jgi:hypothetical protein
MAATSDAGDIGPPSMEQLVEVIIGEVNPVRNSCSA